MTDDYIDVADTGESIELPLVDILTGRGFVTGKSGSGKSNSVNVIVEELLDRNQPLLIVDTDGEYWGLKEQYQILHLGNGEQCDVRVTSTDAETIVDLALVERVPIILDISGFMHKEDAQEITHRVVRELFHREKTLKEPFLLIVEEVHEYIPESGGLSDMGKMLIQVAKRGRKHGLGFVGVSQRPASVDKDFITQCDWIVWHRLTWKNDTDVVSTILGNDAADTVEDLDPGEGLLMTDWDEQVRDVQVRKKRTFDAGATPGFDDFEPPELIPVNPAILNRFDERRQNVDYGTTDGQDEDENGDETDEQATDADAASAAEEDTDTSEASPPAKTTPVDEASEEAPEEATDAATADVADDDGADANDVSDGEEGAAEAADAAIVEADDPPQEDSETAVERRPLGDEPVQAEIVQSQPGAAASGPERAPRRARNRPQTPTPPADTSEGIVVEFTELVLFLAGWVRNAVERGLLRMARAIGRVASGLRGTTDRVGTKTRLADEDVVVAMWLALLVAFILLLSVILVAVF